MKKSISLKATQNGKPTLRSAKKMIMWSSATGETAVKAAGSAWMYVPSRFGRSLKLKISGTDRS